jgi:hypothetical protein
MSVKSCGILIYVNNPNKELDRRIHTYIHTYIQCEVNFTTLVISLFPLRSFHLEEYVPYSCCIMMNSSFLARSYFPCTDFSLSKDHMVFRHLFLQMVWCLTDSDDSYTMCSLYVKYKNNDISRSINILTAPLHIVLSKIVHETKE